MITTLAEHLKNEITEQKKLLDRAYEKNQALKAENEKLKWQIKHDQMRIKKLQSEMDELRKQVIRFPVGVIRV